MSTKIITHVNLLQNLCWTDFVGGAFKPAVNCIKDEVKLIVLILNRHKEKIAGAILDKKKALLDLTSKPRDVNAAFKNSLQTVNIADDEFHSKVDPAFRVKKRGIGGRNPGKFSLGVRAAVDHIIDNLRGRNDYNPLFLTDEEMGIDKYSEDLGENFLASAGRAQYRDRFWKELKARVERICIHVFGKDNVSNEPDCIFVWKVPAIQGKQHDRLVCKAIQECRDMMPKQMSREAIKHFNAVINHISEVPSGAIKALRNYIFLGNPNPDETVADEYV